MATSRQRREEQRRRQQEERRRAAQRQRLTVIAALIGTVAVIAAVVIVVLANRDGDDTPSASTGSSSSADTGSSPSDSSSSEPVACGTEQFAARQVRAAKGATVSFAGVSIKGATDLGGKPGVTSKASAAPATLRYKDLVVGKGKAADPTSCVTVQYDGVLYKSGKEFDSSWSRGMLAQFPLTGVVPGFTQGIGGTTGVPPMKVGGRRVVILPADLGYGAAGSPPTIPANAPLVFVIDLTKVSAG